MNLRTFLIVVAVLVLGAGAIAVFKTGKQDVSEALFITEDQIETGSIIVRMTPDGIVPQDITISRGEKVVWLNVSGTYAWPASDLHPTHAIYSAFDPLEPIPDGQAWVFAFDQAGEWKFHDHLKPNRRGVVKVN